LGLKVIPWTVNDPAEMTRLVDLKVDGLITDYPDRAQPILRQKGLNWR
jgi:glycerophosphoryl diester phosphodiesterase